MLSCGFKKIKATVSKKKTILHNYLENLEDLLKKFLFPKNLQVAYDASKHGLVLSILDGVGMGIGFTFAITLVGAIRELLGDGKLFGYMVFGPSFQPVLIMILAPGAFITMGLLMGYFNLLDEKLRAKAEAKTEKG